MLTPTENLKINNQIASKSIFGLFQEYHDRRFLFVEPGGNFGDYLIYNGAKKLARLAHLNVLTMKHEEFMKANIAEKDIVYIHGSGGLNPFWSGNPIEEFVKAVNANKGITILGPSTFCTDSTFLRDSFINRMKGRRANKVYIFCRDFMSFNALKEVLPDWISLGIDHDTAFNLTPSDLKTGVTNGQYILYAIREDKESRAFQKTNPFSLWIDPIQHCRSFEHWVLVHNKARKIITNRLHSAALGTILGKDVTLLPNSYHKNRSVWEYSLKSRGVIWQDSLSASTFENKLVKSKIYQKLLNSYKVKTFVQSILGAN